MTGAMCCGVETFRTGAGGACYGPAWDTEFSREGCVDERWVRFVCIRETANDCRCLVG